MDGDEGLQCGGCDNQLQAETKLIDSEYTTVGFVGFNEIDAIGAGGYDVAKDYPAEPI